MALSLGILLWATEGNEDALAGYIRDPERQALSEVHARVISRTHVIRVEAVR